MHIIILLQNVKGRDHAEDVGVDGRIILEWILGKQDEKIWIGCKWLKVRSSGGFL
jgi:hypothetical protein